MLSFQVTRGAETAAAALCVGRFSQGASDFSGVVEPNPAQPSAKRRKLQETDKKESDPEWLNHGLDRFVIRQSIRNSYAQFKMEFKEWDTEKQFFLLRNGFRLFPSQALESMGFNMTYKHPLAADLFLQLECPKCHSQLSSCSVFLYDTWLRLGPGSVHAALAGDNTHHCLTCVGNKLVPIINRLCKGKAVPQSRLLSLLTRHYPDQIVSKFLSDYVSDLVVREGNLATLEPQLNVVDSHVPFDWSILCEDLWEHVSKLVDNEQDVRSFRKVCHFFHDLMNNRFKPKVVQVHPKLMSVKINNLFPWTPFVKPSKASRCDLTFSLSNTCPGTKLHVLTKELPVQFLKGARKLVIEAAENTLAANRVLPVDDVFCVPSKIEELELLGVHLEKYTSLERFTQLKRFALSETAGSTASDFVGGFNWRFVNYHRKLESLTLKHSSAGVFVPLSKWVPFFRLREFVVEQPREKLQLVVVSCPNRCRWYETLQSIKLKQVTVEAGSLELPFLELTEIQLVECAIDVQDLIVLISNSPKLSKLELDLVLGAGQSAEDYWHQVQDCLTRSNHPGLLEENISIRFVNQQ